MKPLYSTRRYSEKSFAWIVLSMADYTVLVFAYAWDFDSDVCICDYRYFLNETREGTAALLAWSGLFLLLFLRLMFATLNRISNEDICIGKYGQTVGIS